MKLLNKLFSILTNDNYQKSFLKHDLAAGITVGIMLIPQAMAYSVIAGLPPVYGLYSSILPLIIYAFLGSSKHISLGIIAVDMLIISAGLSGLGISAEEEYLAAVMILTLMTGCIQLLMFSLRLGFLLKYLSKPLITGFTTAAAIIIMSGQIGNFLGINLPKTNYLFEIVFAAFKNISQVNTPNLLIGFFGILLIILLKKINSKLPAYLFLIVAAVTSSYFLKFSDYGVEIIGRINAGLPLPDFSFLNFRLFRELFPTALSLAFVQFMSIVTLGKTYADKHNYTLKPNRELWVFGLSNLLNSFIKGLPVSASFSRSAVNEQAGAKSALSNLFTALVVILVLLFAAKLFYYLPIVALSVIVIVSSYNLVNFKEIKNLYKIKKTDWLVAIITFFTAIIIGIQTGILLGIGASIVAILYKHSNPNVAELGHLPGTSTFRDLTRNEEAEKLENILILRIDASFSFINAEFFKDYIFKKTKERNGKIDDVIIEGKVINDLDTTALAALRFILESLKGQEIHLYLTGLKGPIRDVMKKDGIYEELVKKNHIFQTTSQAIDYILKGLESDDEIKNLRAYYLKNTEEI